RRGADGGAGASVRAADPPHRRRPLSLPLRARTRCAAGEPFTRSPAAPSRATRPGGRQNRLDVDQPGSATGETLVAHARRTRPTLRAALRGFERAGLHRRPARGPGPRRQPGRLRDAPLQARGVARDAGLAHPPGRAASAERVPRPRPSRRTGLDDQAHLPDEAGAVPANRDVPARVRQRRRRPHPRPGARPQRAPPAQTRRLSRRTDPTQAQTRVFVAWERTRPTKRCARARAGTETAERWTSSTPSPASGAGSTTT